MDIDRPLDDMIPKRKPRSSGPRGGGGGADRSDRRRSRGSDAPYSRPPPRSTDEKWVHDAYEGNGGGRKPASFGSGAGAGAGPAMPVTQSPRIEVSGVHYEVTPEELKSVFQQAGTIVHGPDIRYDRAGRSTGVCTVEYSSAAEAKSALNQFDGAMMKGQTITIKLVAPPRPRDGKTKKKPSFGDPNSGQSLLARLGGGQAAGGPKQRNSSRTDSSAPRRGGGRGGRPDAQRGQSGRGKRAPASAADLDAELAGFMKADDVAM